ncbi:(d)CMP kinase [Mesomycoplasma flocculare]|uniref:Cytidylate kinase n=2 Tax=Mesomycoplasma flocculare TaxID=2128 RepID=A0A0A8EBX4_MESFC|nr:(d)CMP kinase [Mesomycoplasma flocculare]MXR39275.1 (d)CMP kinase [Mycoplasma sp. MF12]AJC49646.1 cytidylate kinase [Mesomycoplasma flocculare ATCC 27399]ENX50859.1 cytidylate kinase [Mesomycoplasma flocculare ATCC 27716]MXR05689.1 (d)CMP kinase [Mesomycoplasma flocculare]MXR12059.1 (d)CMP kinase [Mesomycoplasma flocculare]
MTFKKINIAIDGPSGVGKSSIAKKIAQKFNYLFINTGSLYRAIAFFCQKKQISVQNVQKILKNFMPNFLLLDLEGNVWLENQNVSSFLRDDLISKNAAVVAQYPQIRKIVTEILQDFQKKHKGIVMEGRDVTYNVMPNADLKIFLWADAETRAKRRCKQNAFLNLETDVQKILKSIEHRDYLDMNRKINPLKKTIDSVFLDTTNFKENQIVDQIIKLVLRKIGQNML